MATTKSNLGSRLILKMYVALLICVMIVMKAPSVNGFAHFKGAHLLSRQSGSRLQMAGALLEKSQSGLKQVKERYGGRTDLIASSSSEQDEDVQAYDDFASADEEEIDPPARGQTITGRVVEIDDNGALVEIGGKMSGFLPVKEASLVPVKNLNTLFEVGQEITGEIVGTFKKMPVISMRSSQLIVAWEQALAAKAADTSFDVTVLEVNRGGAICSAFGLKAFLPGSHYLGTPDASLIGTTLKVTIAL